MKKILIAALICSNAHAALIWSDDFENYDTSLLDLEDQNSAWFTGPVATQSIAVLDNDSSAPATFGNKTLAVGGYAPDFGTGDDTTVVYALSPVAANFTMTGPLPEAHFTTDLILNAGSVASLTDAFRLSLFDSSSNTLTSLLFSAGSTAGTVSVFRNDGGAGTYDTGAALQVNAAYTLKLLMNMDYQKWSATITPTGSTAAPVTLFANVNLTANTAAQADLGGFVLDWISGDSGANWGENSLNLDNMVLESAVPEPSSAMVLALCAVACLQRRRR